MTFITQHPLRGVGAGGFVPTLVERLPTLTPEPVHNVPLLAAAETGVGGGLAVVALEICVVWQAWRRRGRARFAVTPAILSAVVIGLMVIAAFDHFLWSVSAGRLLAAVVIGVWAGADELHPRD